MKSISRPRRRAKEMQAVPASAKSSPDIAADKPAAFSHGQAQRAAEGLRKASRGLSLGGIAIKALIEEGRS